MSDLFSNLYLGFSVALSAQNLIYCTIGVVLGTFIGALPGIGALAAIAMLLPLTFYVEPTAALIMLAGIYYGAAYGGSISSILLNLPGTASTAVTCLDGYPMTKQGRGGVALFITAIASFWGGLVGLLLLVTMTPFLVSFALRFGAAEYVSMMVLGLVAAALLSTESPFKSLAMVVLGVTMGLIGTDVNTGQIRFAFGIPQLYEGLPIVAVALGLFGISEMIRTAASRTGAPMENRKVTFRSMIPSRADWRRSWPAMLRGSGIGSFIGVLPGAGALIASFMAYAVEQRVHQRPEEFGKGAIEGVSAPESSNNAAVQTAFIPTLALGIPGDAAPALLLAVMMIHGVTPGPQFMTTHPEMFWGLTASFLIGNLLLLILNIPLIGVWVRMITIPYQTLLPIIVTLSCVGVYSVAYAPIHLYVLMAFGLLGFVMAFLQFSAAALILGIILGPLLEENFRRALIIARGDYSTFVGSPISIAFLGLTALIIASAFFRALRQRRPAP